MDVENEGVAQECESESSLKILNASNDFLDAFNGRYLKSILRPTNLNLNFNDLTLDQILRGVPRKEEYTDARWGWENSQLRLTEIRLKHASVAGGDWSRNKIGRCKMPEEITSDLYKYWRDRYKLFRKYDEGVLLDREMWYSVTPEVLAEHIASRCGSQDIVVDGFCGAGGNAIQFATRCKKVIAVDIDPVRIQMARHNARIYGVEDRITFVCGDFLRVAPTLTADLVFLSPPWGGPDYAYQNKFRLEDITPCIYETFKVSRAVAPRIALFAPRHTALSDLKTLTPLPIEVEKAYINDKYTAITVYMDSTTPQATLNDPLAAEWGVKGNHWDFRIRKRSPARRHCPMDLP